MRESKRLTNLIVDKILENPEAAKDYLRQMVEDWSTYEKRDYLGIEDDS